MAVGIGVLFETQYLYGIPERPASFLLSETIDKEPYRLFTSDMFVHSDINRGMYGSVPYITGHSNSFDSSFLWLNAADTWTDLI